MYQYDQSLFVDYYTLIYPKICGKKKDNQMYIIKNYKTTMARFSIRYFLDLLEEAFFMVAMTSLEIYGIKSSRQTVEAEIAGGRWSFLSLINFWLFSFRIKWKITCQHLKYLKRKTTGYCSVRSSPANRTRLLPQVKCGGPT